MSGVAVKHVSEVLKRVLTTVKRELSFDIESEIAVDPIMAELFFYSRYKKKLLILFSHQKYAVYYGMHVKCMVVTTPSSSHFLLIERLLDVTAEHYEKHVCERIQNLAEILVSNVWREYC